MPNDRDDVASAPDLAYVKLDALAEQASRGGVSQRPLSVSSAFAADHLWEAPVLGPSLFSTPFAATVWSEGRRAIEFTAVGNGFSGGVPGTVRLEIGGQDGPSAPIADETASLTPLEFGQFSRSELATATPLNAPVSALIGTSPAVAQQGRSDISTVLQSPPPADDLAWNAEAAEVGLLDVAQAAERLAGTFALMRSLDVRNARQPTDAASPATPAVGERGIASFGHTSDTGSINQLNHEFQNISVRQEKIANELKVLQRIDGLLSNIVSSSIPRIISAMDAEKSVLLRIEQNTHQDLIDKFNKIGGALNTAADLGIKGYALFKLARAARAARAGAAADGGAEAISTDAVAEASVEAAAPTVAEGVGAGELAGFVGLEAGVDSTGIGLPIGAALAVGAGGYMAIKALRDLDSKQKAYDQFAQAYGGGDLSGLSDQQLMSAGAKLKDDVDRQETRIKQLYQGRLVIPPGSSWETNLAADYRQAKVIVDEERRRHAIESTGPIGGAGGLSPNAADVAIGAGLANLPVKSVKAITAAFGSLGDAISHTGKLLQIVVPQLLNESGALNSATAAFNGPKGLTASAHAAAAALDGLASRHAHVPDNCCSSPTQITTKINLDGRAIATVVSKYQAHSICAPGGSHLAPDGNYGLRPVQAGV